MRIARLITILSLILEAFSEVIISKTTKMVMLLYAYLDSFVHKRTNVSNVKPENRIDILSSHIV